MQLDNWVTRVPDQPTPLPPSYGHVALDLFVFVASSFSSSSCDASPTSLPFLHGFASIDESYSGRTKCTFRRGFLHGLAPFWVRKEGRARAELTAATTAEFVLGPNLAKAKNVCEHMSINLVGNVTAIANRTVV